MTRKHIFPAGVYLIGDPCHTIPNDEWDGIIEATNCFGSDSWVYERKAEGKPIGTDFDDGVYHWNGKTCFASGTRYGDGFYSSRGGAVQVGVDAGLIGIIPLTIGKQEGEPYKSFCGSIVDFKSDFEVWEEKGVFHFGKIKIDTN